MYIHAYIIIIIIIIVTMIIKNVKKGLIIPAVLINPLCPFFCNLKTGGPPGLINHLAGTWLINHQCWNSCFVLSKSFKWFPYGFLMLYLSWNHMNTRTHHCWSLKIWKNYYSPNDRFLMKFSIKIISLDSSQRVPPWAHVPH